MTDAASLQERIDLAKLLKILISRAAQIIVQSRDGNKVHTKCNPSVSGHATFNLVIRDVVPVDKEVKQLINASNDRWSPLCVEIFLKTAEGDYMSLEMWSISLISDLCDFTKSFTLYNRLGLLLKSLVAITRVIPAYRYARRQSPDVYTLGYKIYQGDPQIALLGDKYKELKIGKIGMAIGTLSLSVVYRTVMLLPSELSDNGSSTMINSDNFKPDFGVKENEQEDSLSDESSYKVGAFAELRNNPEEMLNDYLIPAVPFGSLLSLKSNSPPSKNNITMETELSMTHPISDATEAKSAALNNDIFRPKSVNDDFIMIDLVKPPPFAESNGNIELGMFFQEWKCAPPLKTCPIDPPVIEQVGDLTKQLKSYESNLKEFDNMVTSLCIENSDEIL